ncbi:MAG: radical SAM protein, partial [Alphaproteobacteria bacterium]|nr:radical SAM protein [Alphaproteobacteria bacterium]
MTTTRLLDVHDHDRTFTAMRYVYPVLSRRAGGVSIGINLNTNNACNWHCAYCQVPGLVRDKAPPVDLELLRSEL